MSFALSSVCSDDVEFPFVRVEFLFRVVEEVSSVVEYDDDVSSVVEDEPSSVVEVSVGKVMSVGLSVDVVEKVSSVVVPTVDEVVGSSVVVLKYPLLFAIIIKTIIRCKITKTNV